MASAAIIGAVAAGTGAAAAVVGVVGAQKSQKEQQLLAQEQQSLQTQQLLELGIDAEQNEANNAVRRDAIIKERDKQRRISRARSEVLETQQRRARINEARIVSAQQIAAGSEAGFTGTAGAAAADLGAAVGAARTEGAFNILLQQSQLRQQDILNKLVDVKTLPGFKDGTPATAQPLPAPTPFTSADKARQQASFTQRTAQTGSELSRNTTFFEQHFGRKSTS